MGSSGAVVTATSIDGVTDIVSIRDLRVSTVIGVYDWEREIEQALTFSVDMAGDVARAASRDDLRDALDYSAVAHTVKCVVIEGKFQLIETAAERVAQRLIADFGLAMGPGPGRQADHQRGLHGRDHHRARHAPGEAALGTARSRIRSVMQRSQTGANLIAVGGQRPGNNQRLQVLECS